MAVIPEGQSYGISEKHDRTLEERRGLSEAYIDIQKYISEYSGLSKHDTKLFNTMLDKQMSTIKLMLTEINIEKRLGKRADDFADMFFVKFQNDIDRTMNARTDVSSEYSGKIEKLLFAIGAITSLRLDGHDTKRFFESLPKEPSEPERYEGDELISDAISQLEEAIMAALPPDFPADHRSVIEECSKELRIPRSRPSDRALTYLMRARVPYNRFYTAEASARITLIMRPLLQGGLLALNDLPRNANAEEVSKVLSDLRKSIELAFRTKNNDVV